MNRRWEFDALRGLMLVLMTFTHLPSRLSSPLGQPFGFVSAAEGFVLLSAVMAGMIYGRMARRDGIEAMERAFWKRALKVYLCQLALMLFLFTVVAMLGLARGEPAVTNLMSFYLQHPVLALPAAALLVYQPALMDILPMYVLFMLASPWVMAWGLRRGWGPVMALSVGLWVVAQFGVEMRLHGLLEHHLAFPVPWRDTGAFSLMAWQFLWVMGLWLGAGRQPHSPPHLRFPSWAVTLAVMLALVGLAWRHTMGQAPFGANVALNMVFDKWQLAPMRVLNLFALIVVVLRFGPWLAARMPRLRWLETLGMASLPVFCAHLVVVLLVLSIWGGSPTARPVWGDVLLVAGCFGILYAVARISVALDRLPPRGKGGRPAAPFSARPSPSSHAPVPVQAPTAAAASRPTSSARPAPLSPPSPPLGPVPPVPPAPL